MPIEKIDVKECITKKLECDLSQNIINYKKWSTYMEVASIIILLINICIGVVLGVVFWDVFIVIVILILGAVISVVLMLCGFLLGKNWTIAVERCVSSQSSGSEIIIPE